MFIYLKVQFRSKTGEKKDILIMLKKIILKGYKFKILVHQVSYSSGFIKQKTARVIRRNRNTLDIVNLNMRL